MPFDFKKDYIKQQPKQTELCLTAQGLECPLGLTVLSCFHAGCCRLGGGHLGLALQVQQMQPGCLSAFGSKDIFLGIPAHACMAKQPLHCTPSSHYLKKGSIHTNYRRNQNVRNRSNNASISYTVSKHNTNICQLSFPIPLTGR